MHSNFESITALKSSYKIQDCVTSDLGAEKHIFHPISTLKKGVAFKKLDFLLVNDALVWLKLTLCSWRGLLYFVDVFPLSKQRGYHWNKIEFPQGFFTYNLFFHNHTLTQLCHILHNTFPL